MVVKKFKLATLSEALHEALITHIGSVVQGTRRVKLTIFV